MAKKNEILLSIALDGDSEVKRKLVDVGETGKRSLENIGRNLASAKDGGFGKLKESADGLREALAPLTEASGLGNLLGGAGLGGLLGRLASPSGILAGLGAAITAVLVGMAKIGEETQRVKGRLSGLGDAKGFDRLTDRAKTLGTDVASLQPRYERFLATQQKINATNTSVIHPPGFQPGAAEETAGGVTVLGGNGKQLSAPSRENFGKFDNALLAQIRRDVKSPDDAKRIADEFQQSLATNGLTPDALRNLQQSSPNAANFLTSQLSKTLGRGFENPNALAAEIERGRVPQNQLGGTAVINAGAAPNPEADKAAKDARGIGQGAEALQAAIGRKLEELGGDKAGLGAGLDKAAESIDKLHLGSNPIESPNGPLAVPARAAGNYLNPLGLLPSIGAGLGSYFNRDAQLPERPSYTPRRFGEDNGVPSSAAGGASLDEATKQTSGALQTLVSAIAEAASAIRNSVGAGAAPPEVPGKASGGGIDITGGGRISGPGTTTSDSVPIAMVSNKEYVIKASSASKLGLRVLDQLNSYADGGSIVPSLLGGLGTGAYDITATDDGGAIINGTFYPPGSPILSEPAVRQALARSRAQKDQDSGQKKHKSEFVGLFGGHNFDTPGSYARGGAIGRIASRGFALGGMIDVPPHLALGGALPDSISGPAPSLGDLNSGGSPWDGVPHLGSADFRTDHGDVRAIGPADTLRHMISAARDSADVQTGPRPSWYRGK